ncbi:MAG: molecular chaperone HtpG, partial [Synergistales bacterium]|nr:molecular chaperone HtpG [Synergistales bacterium]
VLKEGLAQDDGNGEAIKKLCLFSSTYGEGDLVTLEEYVSRMKSDQEHIHYITGPSVDILRSSPHLESLLEAGEEVLLLADPVDEIWVQGSHFGDKPLRSAAQGVSVSDDKSEEEKSSPLVEFIKETLKDTVKDVRISTRLKSSPACIVGEEYDMTPQMEKIMRAMGKEVPEVKRILEINPSHEVLKKMTSLMEEGDKDQMIPFCHVLYGQALLAEGGTLKDPSAFSRHLSLVMKKALC